MKPPLRHRSVRPRARRGRFSLLAKAVLSLFVVKAVHYGGAKTNGVNNIPLRMAPVVATVSAEEVARGWRVEGVATNAGVSYAMPAGVEPTFNWHRRGTFGEWRRLDLGDFAFPFGTNDETVASFSVFSDGKVRPTPRDAGREIRAVGVPMLALQGTSRFWTADGAGGSRLLTWEGFFLDADTNAPVSAQIELRPSGDFVARSNAVETCYVRVNPNDWDGDGIHNERDARPTVSDGDFFGAANALPAGANEGAYYWLDLAATGGLGVATIRVTCDGPSDLGDHVVVARTNEVCRVPLLAGATYFVESDLPIGHASASSEYAQVETNAATSLTVALPLEFSLAPTRAASSYALCSYPLDVGADLVSAVGGCCLFYAAGGLLHWSCHPVCTCGGESHCISAEATWEGYSASASLCAACGCGEDAPAPTPQDGPYAASVYAGFGRDAVIFEDGYENLPGEWVSRRSTAATLTIHANGGPNGGVLSVTGTNLGKLQKNAGPAFPSHAVAVPAGQSILYEMNYVGVEASGTTNDIAVTATLTENGTGEAFTNRCSLTAVKVEVTADNAAPANADPHRHVFGVLESFHYRQYPSDASVAWLFSEGAEELTPFAPGYMILPATTNQTSGGQCKLRVAHGDVAYTNSFLMVLPQIIASNPRCNENLNMVQGEAGWLLLHLDLHVGPFYVSFQGIDFSEIPDESGNCPHAGYYNDIDKGGYLSHCELAGAGEWHRVSTNGYWCSDKAGRGGRYEQPWLNGWKEWPIPVGWGASRVLRAQFDVPPTTEKFILTSDGTFTIRKYGFEATRDTSNHVTTGGTGNE